MRKNTSDASTMTLDKAGYCLMMMIQLTYSSPFSVSNQFQWNMTRSHQILPNEMIFLSEMQGDFYDLGKRGRLFRLIHIIK